ncbi:MAG: DUF4281 domain-containing protein, partial [Pseudanabaenales cyanobacterium]|nr:DUF4281 domain-containing protein [Pseudanabaenales cyanobacterium]
PFWTLIVLAPNWKVTRRVMDSYLPFLALASLYIYLFIISLDPESVQSFANPTLSDLARLFSDQRVMATGWVHFLVFDLFVGRWIYLEGQRTGVWTRHSLVLCLFAGPMGLLSHILTQIITQRFFAKEDSSEGGAKVETEAA